jgi:L,D-transpeptidase catalytic domain
MKRPITRCRGFSLVTGLAASLTLAIAGPVEAQRSQIKTHEEIGVTRPTGVPVMAVVSLADQHVTIYDATGMILRAPVSTGQTGYETPAGIYSVIQKEAEHYSNLYDDASMPFMQRITWSGIALHAGALPGYPASHGCIRTPHGFAQALFDLTKIGMRVVIVRNDMSPVEISHPALFKPGPIRSEVALATQFADQALDTRHLQSIKIGAPPNTERPLTWRSIAAATAAAADAATKKAEDARKVAARAHAEAARFVMGLFLAEGAKKRAEAQIKELGYTFDGAGEPPASVAFELIMAKALERLSEAQKQGDALRAEGQPKIDAAAAAREEFKAAEVARVAAENEAKIAEARMTPVSVFISRKTQRLYVRQAFQPIFEGPVAIQNPDDPIGTTIFTALSYMSADEDLRWSALAMYDNSKAAPAHRSRGSTERHVEPVVTDVVAAKAALERITIPPDALDRISELVSPGSSLIVTDEAASRETGKDTDFIVLMSGEPQGGVKIRRHSPSSDYDRTYPRSPYEKNPYSWW